jgi:hypothetical protein
MFKLNTPTVVVVVTRVVAVVCAEAFIAMAT